MFSLNAHHKFEDIIHPEYTTSKTETGTKVLQIPNMLSLFQCASPWQNRAGFFILLPSWQTIKMGALNINAATENKVCLT